MAQMTKARNADISLVYHLRELIEDSGWSANAYEVLDAYPVNLDTITKFPSIAVQMSVGNSFPFQIGSPSALSITWLIDIFAKGDGQRDDVTYLIWENLRDNQITLYDFNSGFPASVGNYTGISTLGNINFTNVSYQVIDPDEFSKTIADKHHSLVVAIGYLSVD